MSILHDRDGRQRWHPVTGVNAQTDAHAGQRKCRQADSILKACRIKSCSDMSGSDPITPNPSKGENMKHNWKFTGCHPHNGEYWYKCENCGASDWIAIYGTQDQLLPEECNPPTSPQKQGETK